MTQKETEDALAIKGATIANEDPLAVLLRDQEPEGPDRRGFDIGMGIAEGQTLPGPGKDKFGEERPAFRNAFLFSVDRNRNLDFATRGSQVVKKRSRRRDTTQHLTAWSQLAWIQYRQRTFWGPEVRWNW
jgi:hypothetical protein